MIIAKDNLKMFNLHKAEVALKSVKKKQNKQKRP